jgi:hypothetical protein
MVSGVYLSSFDSYTFLFGNEKRLDVKVYWSNSSQIYVGWEMLTEHVTVTVRLKHSAGIKLVRSTCGKNGFAIETD